ncbi:hypothetical protein C1X72_18395 [Pseudomonas sp. FW306-2-2C-D06B]|nr:hypothetical protein C1X72_18395 [Pseudomonas sp. FW306-2-2C-D06B]PNB00734.1 hypothetical protein C1X74_04250 [Pseudomonas sp. GW460-5]PNB57144.1 hypothetical protein C1X73_17405 [Pseudomonas sp. FW305-130]QDY37931.1 hypothetical protein CHR26_17365 [Pseudomonas putida]
MGAELARKPVGAGAPAKKAPQWMAPALPVIAGKPAPTGTVQASESGYRARMLGSGIAQGFR